MPGRRVDTQRSALLRCGEELFGEFEGQLVGGELVFEVGPLRLEFAVVTGDHALEVRTVLADPHIDRATLVVVEKLDGVDLSSVDLLEVHPDELLQPARARDRVIDPVIAAEVEVVEPVGPSFVARGDLVEFVLHRRGEPVVDEATEMLFEQPDHGERHPRRHQRAAALHDVAAVLDRLDDRGVRRRPADAEVLERLDQRRLGVAGGRGRVVPVGGELLGVHALALLQVRQPALGVVCLAAGLLVDALDVGLQKAGEGDRAAAGVEHDLLARTRGPGDPQRQRRAARIGHLRGHGALPDQLVEPELVGVELAVQLAGGLEHVAGGPDGLVRLLGVLHLAGVLPRRRMQILLAVELAGLVTGGINSAGRQSGRVGAHIGDVAVLVEPLRDAHRALRREPQLAPRLLLQRRGHERRVRPAGVGLLLDRADRQLRATQATRQRGRGGLIEHPHVVGLFHLAQRVEVAPGGHAAPVDHVQLGREGGRRRLRIGHAGVEFGGDVPVPRAAEGHPFAFALHDDPRRDRLHAAGRQFGRDLLPQHRADLVAVQPVQDSAGLLRVDQVVVQVAGVLGGGPDGRFGDLVEHHPLDRYARFERLEQMPGDGLALAVAVRGQVQLVDVLEQVLQLRDRALLLRADDVERLEVVVDVHPEAGPRLGFVLGRHVGGIAGQVADVPSRRLDDVVRAQVASDFARLGRRLDNDEPPDASVTAAPAVPVCHLLLTLHFFGRPQRAMPHSAALRPCRHLTISHPARADAN
nr:hypothetical protein CPGR_05191 [Mycolicibacterium malmesburyense]